MWRHHAGPIVAVGVIASACATNGPIVNQSPDRSAGRDPAGVLVIAHRGASAYAPKDTIPASRAAIRRGADAVEVDVRQTRDRALVTLFNASLAPTTNVEEVFPRRKPWRVGSFTLAEIRRLDAGSWFDQSFAGTKVPTLEQVINTVVPSDLGLIVEVKSPERYPGIGPRVVRELRSHPRLLSRGSDRYVEIESFDWGLMRRLNRMAPRVTVGLAGRPPMQRLQKLATYADAVNPQHAAIDASYVERAHKAGLAIKVWSVNERAGIRRAIALGVDGIYSHRPDVVQRILAKTTRHREPERQP